MSVIITHSTHWQTLPRQARVKNNLLIIKLKHSGSVWRKVIRQKYPGAVSNGVRVKEKKKEKGRQSRKDSSAPEGECEG